MQETTLRNIFLEHKKKYMTRSLFLDCLPNDKIQIAYIGLTQSQLMQTNNQIVS
jgi:hypothetical protein